MATTLPLTSQPAPLAASAGVAGGGAMGLSTARRTQLLQGAAPVTADEQQWTKAVEAGLRGYLQLVQSMNAQRSGEDHAFEQRVLELVNLQRAANGLGALAYDSRLDLASERHNLVQASTRSMAHEGLGDADPGSRIRAAGFNGSWGENVATGQLTPEQVVAEWMASPGHRRNILDPNFHRLGVSYGTGTDGRTYWAQSFGA
jgi:uncharacterized protein YkwD